MNKFLYLYDLMRRNFWLNKNMIFIKHIENSKLFFLFMIWFLNFNQILSQTTLISQTADGGFENGTTFTDNGWITVNATTNTWQVGTAATAFAGSRGAYISNNSGTTWAYTNSSAQTSHFYKDITVPAGETFIVLSFKWKGNGESGWDRFLIYTAPTSVTPVAGTPASSSTAITNATLVYTQPVFTQTSYTSGYVKLPSNLAGTTFRLIFTWQNDGSGGVSPGAALDNINLYSSSSEITNYTINSSLTESTSNFVKFTDAINYINSVTISGSATVNVNAGQTFNENLPCITASSTSSNPIIFQKSGSGNNPKIVSIGTGATDFGICISGSDYITLDGIDVDGSAATTTTNAIEFGYLIRNGSATNGAQYNTIKNCTVTLNKNFISAAANACILTSVSTTQGGVTPTASTGANSYNKYYNLSLSNAQNGIYAVGNTTYPDLSCEFGVVGSGCQTSRSSISNIGGILASTSAYGVYAQYQSGVKIFNFDISNIRSNVNTTAGILLINFSGSNEIYNNKVSDISNSGTTSTGRAVGIELQNSSGTPTTRVYNNFVFDIKSPFTGTATASIYAYGIFCNNTTSASVSEIDNNNVYLSVASGTPTYSSVCFALASTSAVHKVRGNIFVNAFPSQGTTAKHWCWLSTSATSIGAAGSISNYNDLFITSDAGTSGHVGRGSTTNYNTVGNWNSATTQDANSISIDPTFTSSTDLHVSAAGLSGLSGFTPQAWISTDIECDLIVSPYRIGADANTPSPCSAPTAQPGSLNFTNVTASGASGSFTASSPSSDGYIIIRSTSNSLSSSPTNAVNYSVGNTIGGGTVIQVGNLTSFTESSLNANTTYYYYIFSYNSFACSGGPVYLTSNPLTSNITSCLSSPSSPVFSNITDNSLTINWNNISGATNYLLEVSTDNFLTQITGSPFTTNTNSQNLTGLSNSNTYYARVKAQGNTCNSTVSGSANTNLLCSTPFSLAQSVTSNSQTLTSITGTFTAASVAPTGYLVIRTSINIPPTPANNTTYSLGPNAIGYIEYVGTSAGSWTSTGLTLGTTYYYWVFSYNSGANCTGPQYSLSSTSFSQSTLSCPTFQSLISINGATAVSGVSYPTISDAIFALNTCGGISQPTILELTSGYVNELTNNTLTLPAISGMSNTNTITIRPSSGVSNLEISSSVSGPTIFIDGGDYWIIDGRPGGTGSLSGSNLAITNTGSSTSSMSIQIMNDALGNIIRYSNLKLSNGSGDYGVIAIRGGTTNITGNDNNSIEYNNIDGNGVATNGVFCFGSTNKNDNCIIQNNNIFDFFRASVATNGVQVGSNNDAFTISNNSIYQTVARTYTTGATHSGILINNTSGNNFSVNGNQVGGGFSVNGGPTPANKYTIAGSTTNRYKAINLAVGTTTATSVQSNTIAGFDFTSTSASTTNGGPWCGIYVSAGKVNIGSNFGNTIGSSTGNGSISLNLQTNSGGVSSGIYIEAIASDFNISNNSIGSITTTGSAVTIAHGFTGIATLATGTVTVSNNLIGSRTTANSINASNAATTTGTYQYLNGISNTGNSSALTISYNTIANLNNAYVPSSFQSTLNSIVCGISSTTGTATILGDTIRNLTANANATNTGLKASVIGISVTSNAGATISQNIVHSLNSTNTAGTAISVNGIAYSGASTGTNVIERNRIYNLNNSSSTSGKVHAIYIVIGNANIQNNMIRLGYDGSGTAITTPIFIYGIYEEAGTNNYYHNSVFIGGTNVTSNTIIPTTIAFYSGTSSANQRYITNNIFMNARSNSTATGGPKNQAIYLTNGSITPTTLICNYNIYQTTGLGANFGSVGGGSRVDFAAWKAYSTNLDPNSIYDDPLFISPENATAPDLHIDANLNSPADQAGTNVASVTNDFDGETRNLFTEVDIGADAFIKVPANPLPVDLVDFSAYCEDQKVKLNWTTLSEINNDYFGIERSLDGITFLETARIKGNGTSNTSNNYQYIDEQVLSDTYYYRLTQHDFNGFKKQFSVQAVNCMNELNKINIYPNPNSGTFEINGLNENDQIEITDILGKRIFFKFCQSNKESIQIENLNPGIYFLTVKNKQEKVSTLKIIID